MHDKPRSSPVEPVEPVEDLAVPVTVVLAERRLPLERILDLRPGAVLEFARDHRSPLDIVVHGSRIGSGRAVDLGDRLGFLVERVDGASGVPPPRLLS